MRKGDPTADPSFIAAISPQELSQAGSAGEMDTSSERIRNFEWQHYLRQRRQYYLEPQRARSGMRLGAPNDPPDDLAGIALSGGGIRSATFALGVLQALANHDLLRRFDYLSTVSGGGYIGSSLTWLTSKLVADKTDKPEADDTETDKAEAANAAPSLPSGGFGLGPSRELRSAEPFPYGTENPRTAREADEAGAAGAMLRYLRQHGNYLTPGKGITLTSVIVVLLRGVILNLLVWIPIVATAMWFLIWSSQQSLPGPLVEWIPAPTVGLIASISPPLKPNGDPELFWTGIEEPPLFSFGIMLAGALVLFAYCASAFVAYSLLTYTRHDSSGRCADEGKHPWRRRFEGWMPWLDGTKYGSRRWFEQSMRWPLWCIGALLLVASVPFVVGGLHGWLLGSSFSLIGLGSGFLAFVRTMQPRKSKAEQEASWAIPSSWIASFGAGFLLYGVLLVAYAFGWWVAEGSPLLGISPFWILLCALVLALLTGRVVDLNLITIHRFYRDRLMEAFLPDVDKALRNQTAPAHDADSATLSSMCDGERPAGPYHIINANLVLTESDERTYRIRGGDSFILSPLLCGSNATGWQPTDDYVGDELTLPTAMAISGAAANPWTGSGGVGVTRNPLVAMLMALMNLRLGFWLPNPKDRSRCKHSFRPHHFNPGLQEVVGGNLTENSPICLLSDGGHFENLGLYELVRRRVRLIVLCDGTADPDYAFADLQNAMARVWTDFGVRIEFDEATTLRQFMPSIEAIYPRDVRLSECAYAVAQIIYSDGRTTGHLVYLTTALCKGLRLKLMGYKGANQDFPDQSTADQFFDEEQFEAYRELGYEIADSFIMHDMKNGGMLGPSIRTRFHLHAAE